ncbi:hypothetical protein T01_1948 [Trichinella spiralis]|uniref:HTH CENPB-type domain-containing protein n=1 Tax=Trichinella spiralis TaxID=6334 RepID=A0A0V1BDI9_TRISP|nr:hypothetical protein T01_1948 [Trichinella spiralis]
MFSVANGFTRYVSQYSETCVSRQPPKSRRRRMREAVNAEVNELLFHLFIRCPAKLKPITRQLLQTKTVDITRRMSVIICASSGWMESFRRYHHNI